MVLALHGFNDYSNGFDGMAKTFSQHAITSYAIDQRGFGTTSQRGLWAGLDVMQADLLLTADLLCKRHPDLPLFLLGESMGGAVIISAAEALENSCIQGVVLSAPAVWGWQSMPWWQGLILRMVAHTLPAYTLTGEGLDIKPSDNIEMLRALGRDPLVIKRTRIDTIYGLTNLMEDAQVNSAKLHLPALLLYGEHDEIIPPQATCLMIRQLSPSQENWDMVLYPEGYHMLIRDLQGKVVIRDIIAWLHDRNASFPSGNEVAPDQPRLAQLCK